MTSKLARNTPVIMQMEATECGAACLGMILANYDRWVPLETLRVSCGVSRDGAKVANILKAAQAYNLQAEERTLSVDELRESASFPCIVSWKGGHFVVVRGFKGNSAYLNDPKRGAVKLSVGEFAQSFMGTVLIMSPTAAFEKGGKPASTIDFIRDRLKNMTLPIVFVALASFVISVATVISASLSRVYMDNVLTGNNSLWLVPILVMLATMVAIQVAVNIANAVYLNRICGKFAVVGASQFMWHLLHLPAGFYEQRAIGDLQQRQEANETIAATLVRQLAPAIFNALLLVLYLVVMIGFSWKLTIVGVVTVALNTFAAHFVSRARVNVTRQQMRDNGLLYSSTIAGIESIETVKASGAEDGYFERWAGYQALVNDVNVRFSKMDLYFGAIPQLLADLANIAVLILGTYLIMHGEFTAGMLLAFQGLLSNFMGPVDSIIGLGQQVQETRTAMERVQDVLQYPADSSEVDGPADVSSNGKREGATTGVEGQVVTGGSADVRETPTVEEGAKAAFSGCSQGFDKLTGNVEIDHVTFGYSPLEPPLIKDFSLTIHQGDWVALVGLSGSGKSTIAKLVSGIYEPWDGEIRFDGVPRADIDPERLHGSLAVVDQDIVTFTDTVDANIRLWDRSIEEFEVILAANDAGIHDEIMDRDQGYRERIAPRGRNFSGGQLQRIEIARALAGDPSILILDEATSALDAKTEVHVIRAIRDRGITCIVVAHRLSTIRDCDEIIVLSEGCVVERGTHDELIAKNGSYAELVRSS